MGCCSSAPEVKEVKKPVKEVNTNPKIVSKTVSSKSNTNKITQAETENDNKSDKESLKLTKDQVNDMMGQLTLFLSFLQTRADRKQTIGQGGQGKIRKYYNTKYRREVVEKVVNLNNCTRGTLGVNGIKSLVKEAILLSGFDHPNIVKIFEFKPNPPTIIMEYCAQGSLRQILDKHINSFIVT